MELNLIIETLNHINENQLLLSDNTSAFFKINECEYSTDIIIKGKEVHFNIKALNTSENCKKDQFWNFTSNGEFLVLDRRYYL